jgi:hypothetical protein
VVNTLINPSVKKFRRLKMKSFIKIFTCLLCLSFLSGCASLQDATRSVSSTVSSTVGSITSAIDEKQYAKVPEDQKIGLAEANEKNMLSEKKIKLAKEKSKYADLELDKANLLKEISSLEYDIVRQEAIKRAGLDVKGESGEVIGKMKEKKNKIEGNIMRIDGKMEDVSLSIKRASDEIATAEGDLKKKVSRENPADAPKAKAEKVDQGKMETPAKVKTAEPVKDQEPAKTPEPVKNQPQEQTK